MHYRDSQGGAQYPRSLGEFQSWFATDADCLDYLEWLRWPDGFVCPRCENVGGWRISDGSFKCTRCKAQTAVTAGTLFDRRRTPLTVWFQVCWEFATAKDGVSALAVKRTLQIGSYQTAWAMLHRLRSVLIRPGRELLSGQVEVDETYIGGEEAGLAGGRARGKKALVAVAVEVRSPKGYWAMLDARHSRWVCPHAAHVHHRQHRPRVHRDHRRMVRLPGHRQGRLPP